MVYWRSATKKLYGDEGRSIEVFGLLMLEEDAGFQETRSRGSRRMIFE